MCNPEDEKLCGTHQVSRELNTQGWTLFRHFGYFFRGITFLDLAGSWKILCKNTTISLLTILVIRTCNVVIILL